MDVVSLRVNLNCFHTNNQMSANKNRHISARDDSGLLFCCNIACYLALFRSMADSSTLLFSPNHFDHLEKVTSSSGVTVLMMHVTNSLTMSQGNRNPVDSF